MFSYEGWNGLNFVSQELKDPTRNFPIVICVGIPLVTICYLLVNIAYFTVMTADEMLASRYCNFFRFECKIEYDLVLSPPLLVQRSSKILLGLSHSASLVQPLAPSMVKPLHPLDSLMLQEPMAIFLNLIYLIQDLPLLWRSFSIVRSGNNL